MKEDVDHLTEPLIGRIQAKAGYAEQTTEITGVSTLSLGSFGSQRL